MVREVRFSWDRERPLPPEIARTDWECEDPDWEPLPEKSPRRGRSRSPQHRGSRPDTDSPDNE